MPILVGPKQCGFMEGKTTFDNILAVQDIAHSIDFDAKILPRMLLKVDIGKAYKMIDWNSVLATLTLMNFPNIWISWIQSCISSPTFSFLINGHSTLWIRGHRGLRQGDPISLYLFLLVYQNLTAMLNYGLRNNMIPGFDSRLTKKFNHLMFADDLIIITRFSCFGNQTVELFWFFRKLCKTTRDMRDNYSLIVYNPVNTNIWNDIWILDTPLGMKPTFINMNLPRESFISYGLCG